MEHYEKKISFLGENIQTIRKHRGMKQQELADKIGINMQSLAKIERGVNYPTFDTLEKIMDVLEVTPNELLAPALCALLLKPADGKKKKKA